MKAPAVTVIMLGLSGFSCIAMAQQPAAPVPYHTEPYTRPSAGVFRGAEGPQAEALTAVSETVRAPGAPWLRLRFRDYNLGENSFIVITSLQDGASQRLDAQTLSQWGDTTAFFNGDAVKIELHVAPGEDGIFYRIEELIVGEQVSGLVEGEDITLPEEVEIETEGLIAAEGFEDVPGTQEICGATDDRVRTNDDAVGRVMPQGCTGWIVSNGANLTAGHCQGAGQVVQFNVPTSIADGTPVNPPPEDQYPVTAYTGFASGGEGNDWAVFRTGVNNRGESAIQRQRAFYRMSRDLNPTTVRETGYGLDGPPPLFGDGPRNQDSQTLQTHAAAFVGETITGPSVVVIRYRIDDENGNSGSPVIDTSNRVAIGIGTHAGCTATGGSNAGTGFENENLEITLRDFSGVGANVRHLDSGHPIAQALQDGTVLRPFDTLAEAVNSVPVGGVVSIVTGSYAGASSLNKAMTLRAPVGLVTISG